MGIPGFNGWFSETYAKAYVPLGKVRVDHLYIDLNSVLHTVMRRARNHNHFHKLLHKRLHSILDATCPTKSVMLAVDGPAPLAKLLTQRDRRKKTGRTVDGGETLTGVAITPGTTFMMDLTHSLTYYCCTKMSGRRFRHLVFELSDGTVKGEGEVKVLGRLARPWYPEDPNDTHVILGDDADLILMALTSYKENLYVANSGLNDGRLDSRLPVFAVNLLHQQWAGGWLAKLIQSGQPAESALLHAKLDLTLIAILAKGNDYLPGARGVSLESSGRSGLWGAYQSAASQAGGSAGSLGPLGCVTSIDPATGTPRLDAAALSRLLQLAGVGGAGSSGGAAADEWLGSKAAADPQLYLRGCVWLLQMYLTGECPDYRFYYDGVAPTATALRATCEAAVAAGHPFIHLDTFGVPDPRAAQPLLPVACALALLPSNCAHLAAPCVRHLMVSPRTSEAGDGDGGMEVEEEEGVEQMEGLVLEGMREAVRKVRRFDEELYDVLYGDCDECKSMGAESARMQRLMGEARSLRATASSRLDAVQRGRAPVGEPPAAQLKAELDAADDKYEVLKSQLNALEQHRKRHTAAKHPYRRFPIEKLEEAAELVLAKGNVGPHERVATEFGRPLVLRAFNNRQEAASFIRTAGGGLAAAAAAAAAPQPFGGQQQPQNGGQYQQQRNAGTWAAAGGPRPTQRQPYGQASYAAEYESLYSPPPPPFAIDNPSFFAAIVRQEVLYDEYGSEEPLQLQLAPQAAGEVVKYMAQPEVAAAQQQQQQHRQQQGQQALASPTPVPFSSRGSGGGGGVTAAARPVAAAGASIGAIVSKGPAAAVAAGAAAAAATAAASAAAAVAGAVTGTGEPHKRARTSGPTTVVVAAAAAGTDVAVVAAAAAVTPPGLARDPHWTGGSAEAAGSAKRRGRKPKATGTASAAGADAEGDAGPSGAGTTAAGAAAYDGDGAGGSAPAEAKSKRGRPRGSKNKSTDAAMSTASDGGGGGDGGSVAAVAMAVAAAAVPGVMAAPAGPPPMPSSRLLSNALAGARPAPAAGTSPGYNPSAPQAPQPYRPLHQQQQQPHHYQQQPYHQQHSGGYGGAPQPAAPVYAQPAAAPYDGSYGSQPQYGYAPPMQYGPGPSSYGGYRPVHMSSYSYGVSQPPHAPPAYAGGAVPAPVLVRPAGYRPPAPQLMAAAAAAASTGPGRSRPPATPGPRWP